MRTVVCRRWYALTQSSCFKKKIIVTRHLKPRQLPVLVQYHFHEHLEELQFRNAREDDCVQIPKKTFHSVRTKCPHLKKLVLSTCSFAGVTLEDMPASLNCLSLRNSAMNHYQFFGGRPSCSASRITCLDVSDVISFLNSEDLHLFRKLKSLRCLFMEGGCGISDSGIKSITDILSHLEVLDVEGTQISNEGVQTIITHGSHLKELYIGHTDIDDGAFLKSHFGRLMKLTALCVRGTDITSSTMKEFANSDVKIKHDFEFDSRYFEKDGKELYPLIWRDTFGYRCCSHSLHHVCCS